MLFAISQIFERFKAISLKLYVFVLCERRFFIFLYFFFFFFLNVMLHLLSFTSMILHLLQCVGGDGEGPELYSVDFLQ